MKSIILFFTIFFYACNATQHQANLNKRITVIGKAVDDKEYAVVITPDHKKYFLDGVEEWETKYHGKQVIVTGTLFIEKHDSLPFYVQGYVGIMLILKKPKWKLASVSS